MWHFLFRGPACCWLLLAIGALGADSGGPSLIDAARGRFPVGVGVSDRIAERPEDWPLLTSQFNMVTPENCLKPVQVQAEEGRFDFTRADEFVNFASSKGLPVVGHCLVWAKDDRTPAWFFRDGANAASRELVLNRHARAHRGGGRALPRAPGNVGCGERGAG